MVNVTELRPGNYFEEDGALFQVLDILLNKTAMRKMVAKLIVDACIYWVKEFGIDGYRFDLMGIIDKHTMNRIYRECVAIKPDFMIYGEGWNMPTALDNSIKTRSIPFKIG